MGRGARALKLERGHATLGTWYTAARARSSGFRPTTSIDVVERALAERPEGRGTRARANSKRPSLRHCTTLRRFRGSCDADGRWARLLVLGIAAAAILRASDRQLAGVNSSREPLLVRAVTCLGSRCWLAGNFTHPEQLPEFVTMHGVKVRIRKGGRLVLSERLSLDIDVSVPAHATLTRSTKMSVVC